jgi:O-antigen ligase
VLPSFEAPKHLFWALYFVAAILRLISNKSLKHWGWPDFFFGIWLTSALASALGAGMAGHHEWKGLKDLFFYSMTAWLVYRSNYSLKQLTNLLLLAVIATIPPLLWGAWLHLGPAHKQYLELKSVGHVNHSAIYLTIVFGISLSVAICKWSKKNIWSASLFIGISALLFVGILVGESRAALGIAVLVSTLLVFLISTSKVIKWLGIGCIAISILTIIAVNPVIVQKHKTNSSINNDALSGRHQVWNVSLEAAKWHPALGLGMDNWKFITPNAIKDSIEKRGEIYQANNYFFPNHSHNVYLTILVERGVIGIGVFIIILLAWGIQLLRNYQASKMNHQLIIWGSSLSAYIVVIGIGTVNTTIHHEHGLLTALCLGIFLAASNSIRSHRKLLE